MGHVLVALVQVHQRCQWTKLPILPNYGSSCLQARQTQGRRLSLRPGKKAHHLGRTHLKGHKLSVNSARGSFNALGAKGGLLVEMTRQKCAGNGLNKERGGLFSVFLFCVSSFLEVLGQKGLGLGNRSRYWSVSGYVSCAWLRVHTCVGHLCRKHELLLCSTVCVPWWQRQMTEAGRAAVDPRLCSVRILSSGAV